MQKKIILFGMLSGAIASSCTAGEAVMMDYMQSVYGNTSFVSDDGIQYAKDVDEYTGPEVQLPTPKESLIQVNDANVIENKGQNAKWLYIADGKAHIQQDLLQNYVMQAVQQNLSEIVSQAVNSSINVWRDQGPIEVVQSQEPETSMTNYEYDSQSETGKSEAIADNSPKSTVGRLSVSRSETPMMEKSAPSTARSAIDHENEPVVAGYASAASSIHENSQSAFLHQMAQMIFMTQQTMQQILEQNNKERELTREMLQRVQANNESIAKYCSDDGAPNSLTQSLIHASIVQQELSDENSSHKSRTAEMSQKQDSPTPERASEQNSESDDADRIGDVLQENGLLASLDGFGIETITETSESIKAEEMNAESSPDIYSTVAEAGTSVAASSMRSVDMEDCDERATPSQFSRYRHMGRSVIEDEESSQQSVDQGTQAEEDDEMVESSILVAEKEVVPSVRKSQELTPRPLHSPKLTEKSVVRLTQSSKSLHAEEKKNDETLDKHATRIIEEENIVSRSSHTRKKSHAEDNKSKETQQSRVPTRFDEERVSRSAMLPTSSISKRRKSETHKPAKESVMLLSNQRVHLERMARDDKYAAICAKLDNMKQYPAYKTAVLNVAKNISAYLQKHGAPTKEIIDSWMKMVFAKAAWNIKTDEQKHVIVDKDLLVAQGVSQNSVQETFLNHCLCSEMIKFLEQRTTNEGPEYRAFLRTYGDNIDRVLQELLSKKTKPSRVLSAVSRVASVNSQFNKEDRQQVVQSVQDNLKQIGSTMAAQCLRCVDVCQSRVFDTLNGIVQDTGNYISNVTDRFIGTIGDGK